MEHRLVTLCVSACLAFVGACSSSPTNADGGTDASNKPDVAVMPDSGTDAGSDASSAYCDGIELKNGAGADVYLIMYPPSSDVYSSCSKLYMQGSGGTPVFASVGASFSQIGGIWEAYSGAAMPPFNGILPGACDDMGVGMAPAGGTFTTPDAGTNVVTAVTAAMGSDAGAQPVSLYGVVTFIAPWGTDSMGQAYGGQIYIQDPAASSPAPHSGIDIYIAKTLVGTSSLPAMAPKRGDVILVSNVTWAPYKGVNEFAYGSTSSITGLGTSPLPAAVPLTATDLASSNTAADQWKGMRVVDKEAFTVLDDCPAPLQYTPSGG